MKKILCFGDSNTFGYNPLNGTRYSMNERWSGIFKQALESTGKCSVIEAGCNNRTCFSKKVPDELCGIKVLHKYLTNDIDIVIFQIGINDAQAMYNLKEEEAKEGFVNFINLAKTLSKNAQIYTLSIPKINENIYINANNFSSLFNKKSIETADKLIEIFKTVSIDNNCEYIDLNNIAKVSKTDGLHYDKIAHYKIAQFLIYYFDI